MRYGTDERWWRVATRRQGTDLTLQEKRHYKRSFKARQRELRCRDEPAGWRHQVRHTFLMLACAALLAEHLVILVQ